MKAWVEKIIRERSQKEKYKTPTGKAFDNDWNSIIYELSQKGGIALDLGCGYSRTPYYFSEHGRCELCVGIDNFKRSEFPEKTNEKIGYIRADAGKLPLRSRSARTVIYRGSLHHLRDYITSLMEAHRVLEDDGTLILSEPFDESYTNRIRMIPSEDHRLLNFNELKAILKGRFEIRSSKPFGYTWYLYANYVPRILSKIFTMNLPIEDLLINLDKIFEKTVKYKFSFHRIIEARKK